MTYTPIYKTHTYAAQSIIFNGAFEDVFDSFERSVTPFKARAARFGCLRVLGHCRTRTPPPNDPGPFSFNQVSLDFNRFHQVRVDKRSLPEEIKATLTSTVSV